MDPKYHEKYICLHYLLIPLQYILVSSSKHEAGLYTYKKLN